jgi:hypothetical protein
LAVDFDGDGRSPCSPFAVDCDDADPLIYAGAVEQCDGVDNDCDGMVDEGFDADGDGVSACGGDDCNDWNAAVRPGAPEACDGLDSDCDGVVLQQEQDHDGDGWFDCNGDCDDADPRAHPGQPEDCINGVDDDCDGLVDESVDLDGDGRSCEADCNDEEGTVYRFAPELCDGLDNDCDGQVDETFDDDGDGFAALGRAGCAGGQFWWDCDDTNPAVHPRLGEIDCADGLDDDCDGQIDEAEDLDGDGVAVCEGDCNDRTELVAPGIAEECDAIDHNCSGAAYEGFDVDGDGVTTCGPDGVDGTADDDCNDLDAQVNPAAAEVCNGRDDDCDDLDGAVGRAENCPQLDPSVDEGPGLDLDGDCWCAAEPASGFAGDCDDGDPARFPGNAEVCDAKDNNCDGRVDEGLDEDRDGFFCSEDCDDASAVVNSDMDEICDDGFDNDCDGGVDVDDDECEGRGYRRQAYGFACDQGDARRGRMLLLGLFLAVAIALRFRSIPAALLLLVVLAPAPGAADTLVLYRSDNLRVRPVVAEKDLVARGIRTNAVEVLEIGALLRSRGFELEVLPKEFGRFCEGPRTDIFDTLEAARRHIEWMELLAAMLGLDEVRKDLPCSVYPLDRATLSDLHFLRGYVLSLLGSDEEARVEYESVLVVDPDRRWDPGLLPEAQPLFESARRSRSGGSGRGRVQLRLNLDASEMGAVWVDGVAREESLVDLLPGEHLVQWALTDGIVRGVVLTVAAGTEEIEVRGSGSLADIVFQAETSLEHTQAAWQLLERVFATGIPYEEVITVDLRGSPPAGEAPALRLLPAKRPVRGTLMPKPWWEDSIQRILTVQEKLEQDRAAGKKFFRPDRLRVTAGGGYRFMQPFSYWALEANITGSVGSQFFYEGALRLLGSPGNEDLTGAPISEGDSGVSAIIPGLGAGLGVLFADQALRPSASLLLSLMLDRPVAGDGVELSPGVEAVLGLDLAPNPEGPVLLRARVAAGFQAFHFLTFDYARTPANQYQLVPSVGISLMAGYRFIERQPDRAAKASASTEISR